MRRGEDATIARAIVEVCPQCGSLDIRAVEPMWFVLELDRELELREIGRVDFVCRDCGTTWC
jgi:predicted RNA-binding Zn-ribbon protein involved in translation (DUF1610 family)